MQSKVKGNTIVASAYADGQFTFTIAGFEPLILPESVIHEEVAHRAFRWGIIKRIVNKAALSRNPDTGKSETPAEKYAEVRAMVEHFASGSADWSLKGAAAGFDNTPLIRSAIMRVKGYDEKQLESFITKYAAAQHGGDAKAALKYLATGQQVGEAMLAIKRERLGTAAVDADAALDAMGDEA